MVVFRLVSVSSDRLNERPLSTSSISSMESECSLDIAGRVCTLHVQWYVYYMYNGMCTTI